MQNLNEKQAKASAARKQVTGPKSSITILREQVASIWTGLHNLVNEVRLIRLLIEGSQDGAAHLAQQQQIQDQAATLQQFRTVMAEQDDDLVRLRALVDELNAKIIETQQGGY